jgi:hypothetical protein
MRIVPVLFLVLLSGAAVGQELTVAEVVAAQRAGAPEEGILRLVAEAPAVVPLSQVDLAALRGAGISERVIRAMLARTVPTPTPPPVLPDDPRLTEVVGMVRSGLPAAAVAEQVRESGQRYTLTVNDLVYLKGNGVPDTVLVALLVSAASPTPVATTKPMPSPAPVERTPVATAMPTPVPASLSFGPLLRMVGVFRRESTGTLVVTSDALEWRDARIQGLGETVSAGSLRGVWLGNVAIGRSRRVSELRVRTVAGDEVTFRDPDWADGGDVLVVEVFRTLQQRFPTVILREKAAP